MHEARAIEQDVDRADVARQRLNGLDERTSSLRLSASRPARPSTSMSVAMTRAPSRAKASSRRAADARRRRRQQRDLTRQSTSQWAAPSIWFRAVRQARLALLGDIAARS